MPSSLVEPSDGVVVDRTDAVGSVDPETSELGMGNKVTVLWGEPTSVSCPSARVAQYPYLDLVPNAKYDLGSVPRYRGAEAAA